MNRNDLPQILNLWVELTGADPSTNSFRLGNLDVRRMHKGLREALELDPSQITAYLLLEYFATHYFGDRSFSITELLEKPEQTTEYLKKAAQLLTMLRTPEIMNIGEVFGLAMRQAVRRYQADTTDVLKIIDDRHKLALLRRDALRSLDHLKVDQFLDGVPEEEGIPPQYNPQVFQFWNINSLLAAACRMPSGISLCLIQDPDEYQSFFAFVVRNGGCLYVLSDVPCHAHPLASQFHHRADRDLDRRAEANHFPYHLLGIKYDKESDRIYIEQKV